MAINQSLSGKIAHRGYVLLILGFAVRNRLLKHSCLVLCSLFTFAYLTSCGTDEELTESGQGAAFDQLWSGVFNRCGSCHGRDVSGTEGGPDLTDKSTFTAMLLGKTGDDYPEWTTFAVNQENCVDKSFIASGRSSQSLVVAIFDSQVASNMGCDVKDHTEPSQNISISSSQLQTLKDWIDEGP